MSFKITKESVKKSQKCPVGMHLMTVVNVEDEYLNDKGTSIQKVDFETDGGYSISKWFNDKFESDIVMFVQAADKIQLGTDMPDTEINLKNYTGKKVAGSVSHQKDKNNKIQAQIDDFFSADKVPF